MSLRAIRRASPMDGPEIRRLITEHLLQSGFDAPDETRDADLVDVGYYQQQGRALWVAENSSGVITGCVAIDAGDPGMAVLRRLTGEPLDDLIATATAFARAVGYREVETVLPPHADALEQALLANDFTPATPGAMLYRLALPVADRDE